MNDTAIPAAMVTLAQGFCREVFALVSRSVDLPLPVLEQGVLEAMRRLAPQALAIVIQQTQRSLGPARTKLPVPCPQCRQLTPVHSWRPRTLRTTCGPVTFTRPWYVCSRCQQGFSPTDITLALTPGQRLSAQLRSQITTLGATTSFAEAADVLKELTGVAVPPETVRRVTEAAGAQVEAAMVAATARVAAGEEPVAPARVQPGRLVVETDGVMVPYRDGWHEVKVGVVAWHRRGRLRTPSYTAGRMPSTAFGPRLLAEAARRGALDVVGWDGGIRERGLAKLRPVTIVGDGAHWIWELAAAHFGERVEVVDWYHASQHVWETAKAVLGEADAAAWVQERLDELWHHDVATMLAAFGRLRPTTPAAREVLRRERQYFTTNALRMAYAALRTADQPTGSGAAESSAKHLIQQRLKRAGCRWNPPGATALIALRCQRATRRASAA